MGKSHRAPDKWSKEAKKRGFRARSAFKLIQINKEYPFLEKSHVLLDLCAAPGGWLQVAAETMPLESVIIGVDLAAIKPIRNVKTFVEDITTQKCRETLRKELAHKMADAVVHDGAPNVGQDWTYDAFTQSTLVLYALKLAVEFLRSGGTFVTKVFRSSDYNSLMYVFQKLFRKVHALQPAASRLQSAETFVVCQGYLAPDVLDPKLLDPNYVFKQIDSGPTHENVLLKKTEKRTRNRDGYDEALGALLYKVVPITEFIHSPDPVQILSSANKLSFGDDEPSQMYKESAMPEILEFCEDLRVLSKSDFKAILKWRNALFRAETAAKEEPKDEESKEKDSKEPQLDDVEYAEHMLQQLHESESRAQKRDRKKLRERLAKQKYRIMLGMEQTAVDLRPDSDVFTVKDMSETQLVSFRSGQMLPSDEDDEEKDGIIIPKEIGEGDKEEEEQSQKDGELELDDEDAKARYVESLDADMNEDFMYYKKMQNDREKTTTASTKKGLKMRKEEEQALLEKIVRERVEGTESEYQKLLHNQLSSESSGDEDYEEEDRNRNKLVKEIDTAPVHTGGAMFFANSLFDDLQSPPSSATVKSARVAKRGRSEPTIEDFYALDAALVMAGSDGEGDDAESEEDGVGESEEEESRSSKKNQKNKKLILPLNVEELPKTEKQLRHEKRLKRLAKEAKRSGKKDDNTFEEVPALVIKDTRIMEGMGKSLVKNGSSSSASRGDSSSFEVVPIDRPARVESSDDDDDSDSDSDEEETHATEEIYDPPTGSDEHLRALALGTLMRRKSKAIELVDSAYNRYAFNDDNLPEWFQADERKFNRPQMPITREMMEQVKKKYQDIAGAPISKVMEARARKKRRLDRLKLKARHKMESVANSDELSAISKARAMAKFEKVANKSTRKKYIVAQKGRPVLPGKKVGRNIKLVDTRMKGETHRAKKKLSGHLRVRNHGTKSRQKRRH